MAPSSNPYQVKIPIWVQMLTGGIAGCIAEVIDSFIF